MICSTLWCLSTCMMSAYLKDACSAVWCCLPVWGLLNYIKSAEYMMTSYLYDVCSALRCLLYCMMPVYLYELFLPVWCLPIWMMTAYLHYVCLPAHIISDYVYFTMWCLDIYMSIYEYLYDIWLLVSCLHICLLTWNMSACLYDLGYLFCVWFSAMMSGYLYNMMSCYLYDVCLNDICSSIWYLPSCIMSVVGRILLCCYPYCLFSRPACQHPSSSACLHPSSSPCCILT